MLGLVGPSIGVATNVSKVIGRLQSLKSVSEDCELLCQTLKSIDGALQLASCLQKRHKLLYLFDGAVRLTQSTIEACDRVLTDEGEDALPASQDGWASWLGRQKQGMRRQDAVPRLTARLGVCMNALQLAFAAMGALQPPLWMQPHGLRQPFALLGDALQQARTAVQEFEMGRRRRLLACMGRLYRRSLSAVEGREGDAEWHADDVHLLWLDLRPDSRYCLDLQRAPQDAASGDDSDGEDRGARPAAKRKDAIRISLQVSTQQLRVSRHWLGDLPGLQPHEHCANLLSDQPAYVLEPREAEADACALLFGVPTLSPDEDEGGGAPAPLSAEAFEAVLAMLLLKDGQEDSEHCLARACDLDSAGGLQGFLDCLRELVGPYEPLATADGPRDGQAVAQLASRLQRASLGP